MLTPAQFYAPSHRGNLYGVKGPLYGPAGHRGMDFNRWPAGTAIPSFAVGSVVRAQRQVGLGWVVTIRCNRLPGSSRSGFVSWCHEQAGSVAVGKRIELGAYVGPLGNTGTLSLGAHVHVVVSYTSDNPASGATVDPAPFIAAGISAFAGGGVAPLPDAPVLAARKGRSMTQLIYTNILEPLTPAQVAFVRACPGGADLKLTVGLALVALVGDGLGRAAVQVTEVPKGGSNPRADGWVADHTGWIDGGTPRQGGRPYEPAEFWDLLAAYASAPASGGAGGGTFVLDDATIAKLAQANAAAFFAEQKKPGN